MKILDCVSLSPGGGIWQVVGYNNTGIYYLRSTVDGRRKSIDPRYYPKIRVTSEEGIWHPVVLRAAQYEQDLQYARNEEADMWRNFRKWLKRILREELEIAVKNGEIMR